ncbi:hypothetical protein H5410_002321 [Solanum commersonii]|uniref:Uncharacterized protein n=1 Tax=Solanum commersonii TaxID=4109 RepID=A0A9J6B1S4_SOLCO|nr:hypothetical protein H5410_002321 [Solanum commersonii]
MIGDVHDCLYKFKATIVDILNKDKLWYLSCKKCSKKVKVIECILSSNNCNNENVEYEMSFERKYVHHVAEKTGPLTWVMQWNMVDL